MLGRKLYSGTFKQRKVGLEWYKVLSFGSSRVPSIMYSVPCDRIVQRAYLTIGPLHDPVTWYGINYTGTQITQWDFQNKGKSGWTGASSFVLEVPLRNLRPSVIYSVPCDRIVQRACYSTSARWI